MAAGTRESFRDTFPAVREIGQGGVREGLFRVCAVRHVSHAQRSWALTRCAKLREPVESTLSTRDDVWMPMEVVECS